MDMLNYFYELVFSPSFLWFTSSLFLIGYTWTSKVNGVDVPDAAHINTLQDEKLDRDGEITWTGISQWDKGADIPSAANLIPGDDGNYFDVTGTTNITSITATRSQPGTVIKLHFNDVLTIVHDSADLILPDGKDIETMAGTEIEFIEYVAGKWRCTSRLRGEPVQVKYLPNSEWKVCSQSYADKGLGTITYKSGGLTALVVGETLTGNTSGATCRVKKYTTDGGTWAGGNAYGVITVGALQGCFQDNETVTGSAAGGDAFTIDGDKSIGITNDPCNNNDVVDWTQDGDSLAFDTDHYEWATSAVDKICYKGSLSFEKGRIYKVEIELKDGVANPTDIQIYFYDGAEQVGVEIDTGGGFVKYTATFECATTTAAGRAGIKAPTSLGGNDIEIRRFSVYEITPCMLNGTYYGFDGWRKDTTASIYRVHNDGGTYTKDGSFYSLQYVPTAINDHLVFPQSDYQESPEWYQQFAGRTVTLGIWIKTSAVNHVRLNINDGSSNYSSYHSGGGGWELLKKTHTFAANPTKAFFGIYTALAGLVDGSTIVYIGQVIVVFGSSIKEENFSSMPGEWVHCEKAIPLSTLNGKTFSDVAFATLNTEAESDAIIPKGATALLIGASVNDDGSAGADCYLVFRKDATLAEQLYFSPYGLVNDAVHRGEGIINLDGNGDLQYKILATNGNFDIPRLKVYAIKLNN